VNRRLDVEKAKSRVGLPGRIAIIVIGVAMLLGGCRPDTAQMDRSDRETALFRTAMEQEKAGNLDEAIRLYGEVLLDHARLASAHLQLAVLLHDHRQDYTGAIYHYQRYLALRPDTEKRGLIVDRIRIAEQLLAAQLLRRVGGDVAGAAQARQVAENDRLNKRIVALEGEKAALLDAKAELERQGKALTADVERLRRLLDRLQMPSTPAAEHRVRPSALPRLERTSEAEPLPRVPPLTTPLPAPPAVVTSLSASAAHSLPGDSGTKTAPVDVPAARAPVASERPSEPVVERADGNLVAPRPLESPMPSAAVIEAVAPHEEPLLRDVAAPSNANTVPRPGTQTYVVQPGDSLFRIAEKIYGDSAQWKKLRDANRNRIDPDGRVRAGQILLIP
jgi:nucleoid-associated protein YgaU